MIRQEDKVRSPPGTLPTWQSVQAAKSSLWAAVLLAATPCPSHLQLSLTSFLLGNHALFFFPIPFPYDFDFLFLSPAIAFVPLAVELKVVFCADPHVLPSFADFAACFIFLLCRGFFRLAPDAPPIRISSSRLVAILARLPASVDCFEWNPTKLPRRGLRLVLRETPTNQTLSNGLRGFPVPSG